MAVALVLGKFFIIASLAFQGYLLFQDKNQSSVFDKNLTTAMQGCSCFTPQIQQLLKQYLRLVVVGLLASAVLILLVKHWSLKVFTLIGLSLLLWVEHHKVFRSIPTLSLLENTAFFHSLGVIGAIIYLAGAQCTSCRKKAVKEAEKPKSAPAVDKKSTSNEKKKN